MSSSEKMVVEHSFHHPMVEYLCPTTTAYTWKE